MEKRNDKGKEYNLYGELEFDESILFFQFYCFYFLYDYIYNIPILK